MATGTLLAPPLVAEVRHLLREHLHDHYTLYGDYLGVRTARKHIGWYLKGLPGAEDFRRHLNLIDDCQRQVLAVSDYLDHINQGMDRLPAVTSSVLAQREQQLEMVQ